MIRTLFATSEEYDLALARLLLGGVFFAHGAQKVLGWWGGNGLAQTLHAFTGGMGLPLPLASLAIAAEFLGGLGLIAGAFVRLAALGIGVEMAVAIVKVHWANGLFMNWFGNQKGEGFEYHLLAIAVAAVLLRRGAGALSIDRRLARR